MHGKKAKGMEQQRAQSTIRVWYRLLDLSGRPYLETTATSVFLDSDRLVDDIRMAVFERLERMTPYVAAALKVYQNLEGFDNRLEKGGHIQPLNEARSIQGLGVSIEEAVIVVVPINQNSVVSVRFPSGWTTKEAWTSYSLVAEKSLGNENTVEIWKKLQDIPSMKKAEVPFVFLGGSSGSGKTQMAITLLHLISRAPEKDQSKPIAFYALYSNGCSTQPIYTNFAAISLLLCECMERDLKSLKSEIGTELKVDDNELSVCKLQYRRMYIYGAIKTLVELYGEEGGNVVALANEKQVSVEPMTGYDVQKYLSENRFQVFFLLDEVVTQEKAVLRLLRNAMRAIKVGLVLLGTDSNVSNIIEVAASSFGDVEWCYVYLLNPEPTWETAELAIGKRVTQRETWIEEIITHSRPRFSSWFLSIFDDECRASPQLNCVDLLDQVLLKLYDQIVPPKRDRDVMAFAIGQLSIFQNVFYEDCITRLPLKKLTCIQQTTQLVHCHYAQIFVPELSHGASMNDQPIRRHEFTLYAAAHQRIFFVGMFPSIHRDILMYLVLLGVKNRSPFRLSYSDDARDCRYFKQIGGNVNALSSNGNFLEIVMSSVVIAASRFGGVAGCPLPLMVKRIIFELSALNLPASKEFQRFNDLYADIVIPYLSPPDQAWPFYVAELNQRGCLFGNTSRLVNTNTSDLHISMPASTDVILSGECNNHQTSLDQSIVDKIVSSIPSTTKVHIVFTRKVSPILDWRVKCKVWILRIHKEHVTLEVMSNNDPVSMAATNTSLKRKRYPSRNMSKQHQSKHVQDHESVQEAKERKVGLEFDALSLKLMLVVVAPDELIKRLQALQQLDTC